MKQQQRQFLLIKLGKVEVLFNESFDDFRELIDGLDFIILTSFY